MWIKPDTSTFEFDGEKYTKASPHQKEWGARLIAELTLQGNERILDLGCGDGVLTRRLADLVPRGVVVGIDASRGMIETARKHEQKNLRFEIMDINQMRFKTQFDLIFSNAALHWVKNHRHLLTNVLDCLRENGMLRFNFAGDGNCAHLYKVVKEAICRQEYAPYFEEFEWPWYMPPVDEYRTILEQFPFKEIKVWSENADRYFQNADELTRWIEQPSIVPFLNRIESVADQQRFRHTVITRMIQATLQKNGTCFETFRRIHVFART